MKRENLPEGKDMYMGDRQMCRFGVADMTWKKNLMSKKSLTLFIPYAIFLP